MFVWVNLGLFCYFAKEEVEDGEILSLRSRMMLMFITSGYPMLFSLISLLLLIHNLCCDKQYEHMAVWHRNSLLNLV